ncbi:uncharacterized protein LOC108038913 [Drosophila rhopaloa]|uniref:Uncharacterized protein n=1 Tax=Drosophila rhopaloa TaxID=1041015 RepID=A0ABM5GXV6_DRORH|nr:uncharacterized protein LOC108038913 [Drosophila rhopaloa]
MSEESENQAISLSFSELQAIDQEDIILLVDVDSAVNISKACIANDSADRVEVLTLWFSKLLRAYLDESVCCFQAVKSMCDWFFHVSNNSYGVNSDQTKLFNEVLAFLTAYRNHLLKAGERLVHWFANLLLFMIDFLEEEGKESEHQVRVGIHFEVLSLLKKNTSESKTFQPRITPLMQTIMQHAESARNNFRDLELPVKSSDTITYMCVHYMSCVNLKDEPMPQWLKETILHLCKMVFGYLEDLYKNGLLTVPEEKLKEFMKVMRAYFLMLQQIFRNGLMQVDRNVAVCIMDLFMCDETTPSHYSEEYIQQLISTYVRPYIMELYELIYSFEECQEYLLFSIFGPPEEDYFDVCLDFVTAVSTDDADVLPKTCQTLQKIFEYLFKDATNFVNAERYERVMDAFGSLLYLVPIKELHSYFCAGLFQKDIITSQVCADILMLCFRLKEENKCWTPIDIEQAIVFWNKCNNSYCMFSKNPSQWHVQRFLKYFHCLGKQGLPALSIRNFRHLLAVITEDKQIGIQLLNRLDHVSSAAPTQVKDYYEMVAMLELLVKNRHTDCSQWFQRSSDMSKKVMSIANSTTFTSAYFKLLAFANKPTQLLILRGLASGNGCTNWHRQRFIDACKVSDDAQLKAFSARHLIDADAQLLLETMRGKPKTSDTSVDGLFDVSKSSYTRNSEHKCLVSSLKRKRNEIPPKQILLDIYEGSLQLSQSTDDFDAADWDLHKKVLANLSSILPRS